MLLLSLLLLSSYLSLSICSLFSVVGIAVLVMSYHDHYYYHHYYHLCLLISITFSISYIPWAKPTHITGRTAPINPQWNLEANGICYMLKICRASPVYEYILNHRKHVGHILDSKQKLITQRTCWEHIWTTAPHNPWCTQTTKMRG